VQAEPARSIFLSFVCVW